MHRRGIAALILSVIALVAAAGCTEGQPTSQEKETSKQQSSYDRLTAAQPAQSAKYSATRDTINAWIKKWGQSPNKLSYVYLQASNGQLIGYYIFKGLPVSYCASLTPTYRLIDNYENDLVVPAPAMDGVYYSGGQCQAYYGIDATTGSYIEYTVGTGISALVYERPLPRQDIEPLGFTEVKDVK